jgi:hypothetical protein
MGNVLLVETSAEVKAQRSAAKVLTKDTTLVQEGTSEVSPWKHLPAVAPAIARLFLQKRRWRASGR